MGQLPNSNKVTNGFRIEVTAEYLPRESSPDDDHYFFAYHVRIGNEGDRAARLKSRIWLIINSDGEVRKVKGPGVIGQTPLIRPGDAFEYTSSCLLDTPWGTMEGSYQMVRGDGNTFEANVGRFYLVSRAAETVGAG